VLAPRRGSLSLRKQKGDGGFFGHIDFFPDANASLQITNRSLVVVGCIEGVSLQTESALYWPIFEPIKPLLFINNLDNALLDRNLEKEELHQCICHMVDAMNTITIAHSDEKLGDLGRLENGAAVLGPGLHR
jgi:translation elongation factor EF-G